MHIWGEFQAGETTYNLSHLNGKEIELIQPEKQNFPQNVFPIYLSFGDHCFTKHYGDDAYIYSEYNGKTRYFCTERYELSLGLPSYIVNLLNTNPYLKCSFTNKKEKFFYIEENYIDITYRIFMNIDKNNRNNNGLRLKVVSAYREENYAQRVVSNGEFRLFRILSAKLKGELLSQRKTNRRASRKR